MRDGRGQRDMAHALPPDARQRDLDAALLADDALVLHALVLAAQAFVVLDRSEDARAEQTIALGLERAIVDRLGLLDLAERPAQYFFRAGDRNLDVVESLGLDHGIEEIHDLLIHAGLLKVGREGSSRLPPRRIKKFANRRGTNPSPQSC